MLLMPAASFAFIVNRIKDEAMLKFLVFTDLEQQPFMDKFEKYCADLITFYTKEFIVTEEKK